MCDSISKPPNLKRDTRVVSNCSVHLGAQPENLHPLATPRPPLAVPPSSLSQPHPQKPLTPLFCAERCTPWICRQGQCQAQRQWNSLGRTSWLGVHKCILNWAPRSPNALQSPLLSSPLLVLQRHFPRQAAERESNGRGLAKRTGTAPAGCQSFGHKISERKFSSLLHRVGTRKHSWVQGWSVHWES